MAEREGAAGVSVITPYFIKPTQAELFDHFRRIAESTSLPVVLYNNPATCGGLSIEPDTVARLAEVPNIVGIKDSSGDLQNTIELIRRTSPETFAVLNGRDTLLYSALARRRTRGDPGDLQRRPGVVRRNLPIVRRR